MLLATWITTLLKCTLKYLTIIVQAVNHVRVMWRVRAEQPTYFPQKVFINHDLVNTSVNNSLNMKFRKRPSEISCIQFRKLVQLSHDRIVVHISIIHHRCYWHIFYHEIKTVKKGGGTKKMQNNYLSYKHV